MTAQSTSDRRRVVAGVDGSDAAIRAAVYAAKVALRRDVAVQIVHVAPAAREDERATRLVDAAAEAARGAVQHAEVSTALIDDHPVDGLIALSDEVALLVVGTRGMDGVAGLLLGSTAGSVVQHAHCPVIVLPDDTTDDTTDGTTDGVERRRSVVVGVEGRPDDAPALAFAVDEAAARDAELVVVHAWREFVPMTSVGGFEPMVDWSTVEKQERRLLTDAVAPWRAQRPEVRIREELVRDYPASALLDLGATADLLVVGHRHRGVLARLGSTTHAILHRAACPVAVVPIPR